MILFMYVCMYICGLDGWMGLVTIGHGSSKSTCGANKIQTIKIYENPKGGELPN